MNYPCDTFLRAIRLYFYISEDKNCKLPLLGIVELYYSCNILKNKVGSNADKYLKFFPSLVSLLVAFPSKLGATCIYSYGSKHSEN